jgi:CheY-like chemotaxis protein
MLVLVVEDEDIIRDNTFEELVEAGFDVLEAANGEEAVQIIEGTDQLGALFTDIRMPGPLDGWQVAEAFRAKRPDGIVLYASGYSVKHTPVSNSLFFRKPYRIQQVVWGIRALAGAASAAQEDSAAEPGWTIAPKSLPKPEV